MSVQYSGSPGSPADESHINSIYIEGEDFELGEFHPEHVSTKDEPATRQDEWLLLRKSNPLKRFFYKIWNGPEEIQDDPPSFPRYWNWLARVDTLPTEIFIKKIPSKATRIFLLVIYCSIWFGVIYSILYSYLVTPPFFYPNDGSERIPVISLSCNSYLHWEGTNNECGYNGEDCGPFTDAEYFIRCPALCDQGGIAYSAVAVGSNKVKYVGYQIGGGLREDESDDENDNDILTYPYRGDSFLCSAAAHSGLISPFTGGCVRAEMDGFQSSFSASEGFFNMGDSVEFLSFFPSSFSFRSFLDGYASGCKDPRSAVVVLNILFGLPVFYLYESLYGYWIITIVGYWTLILALDPPIQVDPHDMITVYELVSVGIQRLLPLCFILYVVWKIAVKRALENGSPVCKVLLWYPMLWLGIMNNVTFDRLPVDRLNPKDLKEQAGAITAVGSIAGTILTCAVIQAYSIWKSGRFRKYFFIYITMILGLVFIASIPGLNLRIHHYILGMLLVPGCSTRGPSAYLFQGILIGLILSGVSRWDFASIAETDIALLRGEAGASLKPPIFSFNESMPHQISWYINSTDTISEPAHGIDTIDGYSLLINDIEVYFGYNETINIDILKENNDQLSFMIDKSLEDSDGGSIDLYLRIARASVKSPSEVRGDYTNGGILEWPEGIWYAPEPGVS